MGKKKGGAKNKLARMSEEERARYLQHRADMEEEARRRKQQLIALYMKNKLKREEAFSRLNLAKINQEWRYILRQIKCQELRNEIAEVERLFKEALEQKNRIIRRLLSDLDEAEDLYSTLQQSYMENINKLIELQSRRMKFFRNKYQREKNTLLKECNEDFGVFKSARYRSQTELECVYFCLEDNTEKEEEAGKEEHLNKIDDLRSKMTIKLEVITLSRENEIEKLWKKYQRVLDDYVQYTESFYAEYSDLRERDEENTKLIRAHCYEVARATEQIAELRIEADFAVEEHEFRIRYLQKYKKDLHDRYVLIKKDLEEILKHDKDQFKHMVINSNFVLELLQKIMSGGETLLQLASICRRLESEREKILPFGATRQILFERSIDELKQPPNDFKESTVDVWFNLENFWMRVNHSRIDIACLQEEKSIVQKENTDFKAQLKEYLASVTLASGSGGSVQDRLRPSSMKIEKVVHIDLSTGNRFAKKKPKRRPVTCIEANLSNAIRSVKLAEGRLKTVNIKSIVNW